MGVDNVGVGVDNVRGVGVGVGVGLGGVDVSEEGRLGTCKVGGVLIVKRGVLLISCCVVLIGWLG